MIFLSLWFRNLNSNSLSGRVPSALGGRLLHRASFKYVHIQKCHCLILFLLSSLRLRLEGYPVHTVGHLMRWTGWMHRCFRSFSELRGNLVYFKPYIINEIFLVQTLQIYIFPWRPSTITHNQ